MPTKYHSVGSARTGRSQNAAPELAAPVHSRRCEETAVLQSRNAAPELPVHSRRREETAVYAQEGGPRVGRASVNRLSDGVAHGASHRLRAYVFLHWIWVPGLVGCCTASDGLRAEAPVDEHVPEEGEEGGDARRRKPARESSRE